MTAVAALENLLSPVGHMFAIVTAQAPGILLVAEQARIGTPLNAHFRKHVRSIDVLHGLHCGIDLRRTSLAHLGIALLIEIRERLAQTGAGVGGGGIVDLEGLDRLPADKRKLLVETAAG